MQPRPRHGVAGNRIQAGESFAALAKSIPMMAAQRAEAVISVC